MDIDDIEFKSAKRLRRDAEKDAAMHSIDRIGYLHRKATAKDKLEKGLIAAQELAVRTQTGAQQFSSKIQRFSAMKIRKGTVLERMARRYR